MFQKVTERQPLISSEKNFKDESSDNGAKAKKGLGVLSTAIFIAGEMAGSGILALPKAIVDCGYIGLVLLVVFCINSAYGGIKLGDCWQIVEERYPEHRKSTRNPYAVIGSKAIGNIGGKLVSHCIRITLFGAGTVYILLASQLFQELLESLLPNLTSCSYFLLIAGMLIPPMWLASPKEFSFVGLGALLTTVAACVLFFIQIVLDGKSRTKEVPHKAHSFHDFFLSFGTLLFAFGGASTFPTIQNDMTNKHHFSKAVIIAFSIILILYFPVSAGGFLVYGEDIDFNITLSLSKSGFVYLANIFMGIHLVFAFLIVTNPVSQELEEAFDIPKTFNWKRCFIRTTMMLAMIVIGESVPQFGAILSLVGGSTITLLTFVFPPYFYMKLCSLEDENWPKRYISFHEKIYMWELILIGLVGGCAATYSAINTIFSHSFAKPCYWTQ